MFSRLPYYPRQSRHKDRDNTQDNHAFKVTHFLSQPSRFALHIKQMPSSYPAMTFCFLQALHVLCFMVYQPLI
jgi:hypothetical protein